MIKRTIRYFALVYTLLFFICGKVSAQNDPTDHVYQYSVKVGSREAYLWIPPKSGHIKGVIISLANLTERLWLEDPFIRKTAAQIGLGIIWVGPAAKGDTLFTANMRPGMAQVFQQMMDSLAEVSGYTELKTAPVIPIGHSANGHFAWTFANALPQRTIAVIPIKTIPLPDSLKFKDIPVCYVVGQTTEWPQYRSPSIATKSGDRDFYWPVVRKSALALRAKSTDNLIGVVTDPGGGHFDWTTNMAKFVALYIRKACQYRLPKAGQIQLRPIHGGSGWLTGTGGMEKDDQSPAPYRYFKGRTADSYWFFDKETAMAAVKFEGDRIKRKKQMPTFIQDGKPLNVTKIGYAPLKFEPHADGVTFDVKGGFLSTIPNELVGAGEKLGHAPGPIKFSIINGPAVQTGATTFRLQFDRWGMGGQIFILESEAGNAAYRYAVQPGMINIPGKLTSGAAQSISFNHIDNVKAGAKMVQLNGTATSGLPVDYYVKAGPAYIVHSKLYFTGIPINSKYPVKLTVVAYQWGRTIAPLYQSAEPVEQTFYIWR
jgi:hypothetical protein